MPRPHRHARQRVDENLAILEVREPDSAARTVTGPAGIEENGPYLTTGKHNNVQRRWASEWAVGSQPGIRDAEPGDPARSNLSPARRAVAGSITQCSPMATSLNMAGGLTDIVFMGDSSGNLSGTSCGRRAQCRVEAGDCPSRADGAVASRRPEFLQLHGTSLKKENLRIHEKLRGYHDDYYIT